MTERPLVEVLVPAYNHERFIGQALDSILMQSIDAPIQITVLEDFSTDATRSIVQSYASTHPDIIRLRLNKRNLNNGRSIMTAIEQSHATYIALLEGDDYWVSADKLQKQVALLDLHADCAFVRHDVHVVYDDGRASHFKDQPGRPPFSSIHNLFLSNFVSTCSTMYRRSSLQAIPEWYSDLVVSDWQLHLLAARSGRIAYINQPMAAYRVHAGGMWSKMSPVEQAETTVLIVKQMFKQFGPKYYPDIRNGLANAYHDLAYAQATAGDQDGAEKSLEAAANGIEPPADSPPEIIESLDVHIQRQGPSTDDRLTAIVTHLLANKDSLANIEALSQKLLDRLDSEARTAAQLDAFAGELVELRRQLASTNDKLETNVAQLLATEAELTNSEAALQVVFSSRSWRATRSLRRAAAAVRNLSQPGILRLRR